MIVAVAACAALGLAALGHPQAFADSGGDHDSTTVQSGEVTWEQHVAGTAAGLVPSPQPVAGSAPLTLEQRGVLAATNAACVTLAASGAATPPQCQPSAPPPSTPPTPGFDVALRLRTQLQLTAPRIRTAPPVGTAAIVGIPTWLWIDADTTQPVSNTATDGPLQVSILAVPQGVDWDTGDGQHLHCDGTGDPYLPGRSDPHAAPPCSHTYTQRSTATDPHHSYSLQATVTWHITWWANTGQSGTLPPTTLTTHTPIKVLEQQAILD